jgi:hypothetical protein
MKKIVSLFVMLTFCYQSSYAVTTAVENKLPTSTTDLTVCANSLKSGTTVDVKYNGKITRYTSKGMKSADTVYLVSKDGKTYSGKINSCSGKPNGGTGGQKLAWFIPILIEIGALILEAILNPAH